MTTQNEYVVFYERDPNDQWSLTNTPVFAMSIENGKISLIGDKSMRDKYASYFQSDVIWKSRHMLSSHPLSSFLSKNPYSPIKFVTGKNAKTDFASIVSKLDGGKTVIGRGEYSNVRIKK